MLKTFDGGHICTPNRSSKILGGKVVAKLFLNDIKKNPRMKPKEIQDQIEDRYNLDVSHDICRKKERKTLDMLQKEHDEQFSRLKDYKQELLDSNPNTTAELVTVSGEGGLEIFDRFYVCFASQLLDAVGRDTNNQFYPVAWAVVQVEDKDSWVWFIEKLQQDLNLGDGTGFTLISDRQMGLLYAVDKLLPKVEHRMCARHIYGKLRSKFPGKPRMRSLFWAVAESFNDADYKKAIDEVKKYDEDVYKAMMDKNPENCSLAYFTTTATCEDVHNNFSESYNNSIDKARAMPLMEMLETIRRQCMIRIDFRKKKSLNHKAAFSLKVANVLEEEKKKLKLCSLVTGEACSKESHS